MEESSEAHMDTGVSSTTDDVQEVHEVASTHHNVETVITVESVKEEDMSPGKNKLAADAKSPATIDTTKPVSKPELTIKKIIIKSPLKDLQVRPIQKSPAKSEENLKTVCKDGSPSKPVQTYSLKPQMADSSSKVDVVKSASTEGEKTVQSTTVNSSDSQKTVNTSPAKDTQTSPIKETQQPEVTKEAAGKAPNKPNYIVITKNKITKPPVKDQPVTVVPKEGPQKIVLVRDSSKIKIKEVSPKQNLSKDNTEIPSSQVLDKEALDKNCLSKQDLTKVSPSKQTSAKDIPDRENPPKDIPPKQSPTKETPAKQTPAKETPAKQTPAKETPAKQTPAKETPAKDTPAKLNISKENPSKQNPTKDTPAKEPLAKETPAKAILARESLAKETLVKEVLAKQSPTKETPVKQMPAKVVSEKLTPAKEIPEKQTPAKEVPNMQTPAKAILAEIVPIKDQPVKTSLQKEPPPKTQSEPPSKSKPENSTQESKEPSLKNKNLSLSEDKEASNDSQIETASDISEKEHNKSISRELRSLINSAKESKIISECTQLTSKTRKSRTPLDTSLNTSVEADKIQCVRRGSDNSQMSNCSEKSDKVGAKRSMRSQNPEFVSKVKNFLNSVSGKKAENETDEDNEEKAKESIENDKQSPVSLPKKKKTEEVVPEKPAMEKITSDKNNKDRIDPYCWRCHWGVEPAANEKPQVKLQCTVCPRSYHFKCLTGAERNKVQAEKSYVCPECILILQAESSETRSTAMKKISLGMLKDLLKHALDRMMEIHGAEPFINPVDRNEFPYYDTYVVHPMDLTLMKKQIDEGLYGSTEAFLADVQWILHNCIIFNTCGNLQAKLTGGARALVRSCRAEMGEIEACPECYAAAHARRPTWFTDVCTTPHILLWAKLKGFPYWPAKGMSINSQGLVDVRFFGAHDRAWVPARDCFLFSEKDPNNFRTKRQDILDSMQEAEQHIRNISRKYGKFMYPPFRTVFDPTKLNEQLKLMIPSFVGEVRSPAKDKASISSPAMKKKRRSNSKSSKGSFHEGDTSEGEENNVKSRTMASGAVIAREKEEDFSVDKEKPKPMDVDPPKKENETSRKRRRSELEEAVITIIDNNSTREKRRRVESADRDKKELKETDKKETTDKKDTDVKEDKAKVETPSTSGDKRIRVISIAKVMKNDSVSPKVAVVKEEEKTPKQKTKTDKTNNKDNTEQEKQKEEKKVKRRNSNKNKSLNNSNIGKVAKTTENETTAEKSNKEKEVDNATKEKAVDATSKEKGKDSPAITTSKDKAAVGNSKEKIAAASTSKEKGKDSPANKSNTSNTVKSDKLETPKSKDRLKFDDDTSLAVLARVGKTNSTSGLPTITSVRSLSEKANTTPSGKSIEITVEATQNSSIFTPTSTDNVKNMREAVNKLQKLRGDNEPSQPAPQVGRVGVRAFARMTSPPEKEIETRPNDVQVEIKAEPMDYEESDKQLQDKIDLMSSFSLRPVNPPTNLRDVRINKVVVTPMARKASTPPQTTNMRAKKTFPQPKKPDEGRSELTSKNSMVYIPIQPPVTQAPLRNNRSATVTISTPPQNRNSVVTTISSHQVISSIANQVNTITPPLVQFSSPSSSGTPTNSSKPIQTVATIGSLGTMTAMGQLATLPTVGQVGGVPTVGQVPTTVHTMPLITSVNGQWTFSLQPVLSVGGIDSDPSPPMMNGLAERPALVPIAPNPASLLVPATPLANNAQTDSQPGELPRLQQRPSLVNPLDANAPDSCVPPPSTVGPLTAKLNQNAVKMTDFFRTLLEDSIEKLDEPLAQVTSLKLQLERIKWRHQQEVDEIRHNHDLILSEMRSSFEKEKVRLVAETRRQSQIELDTAVKQAKTKQWCANCNQEAQFYCCWNTAYCDYPCQRAHWATHYAVCAQHRTQDNMGCDKSNPPENRLQQVPENLPKTTAAPNLAAAKQLQPSRMYTQEQAPQKTSIIMSMVEDNTGNQTMKCVGTYKSPSGGSQMSPLIINKQIMSNEETAKKVVTSGGYLIVGASNATNTTTITPARRATAIQYIS